MSKGEWSVNDDKCYRNCDHADKIVKHKVVISSGLWLIIKAMLKRFPDDEWQMLFAGRIENDTCFCEKYYITKQEVGAATVKHKDEITFDMIKKNGFVAGIHSHVNMSTFASPTDVDDSIMSPIPYHLIVNNRYEIAAYRKAVLPCGGFISTTCLVEIEGLVDLDKVEIEGLERIEKISYATGGVKIIGQDDDKKDNDFKPLKRRKADVQPYPPYLRKDYDRERMESVSQDMLGYGG